MVCIHALSQYAPVVPSNGKSEGYLAHGTTESSVKGWVSHLRSVALTERQEFGIVDNLRKTSTSTILQFITPRAIQPLPNDKFIH